MSALVAAALQKAALKGLNKIGGDVTISYVSAGDYDVTTGTVPDFSTTVETHEVKGVLQDVNAREVNELVQAGDKRLEVPAVELPTAPQTKDRVTVVGVEHQVVRVKTIEQANTPITYVLYLRV